ncbi:putative phosphatidylinositol-3,4,5-trisphosphate 3-phosphatase NDAI_0F02880 [Naumovozyma dairenensis CBS 421]|uniref:phosphatidylinositol-3,4,5-trisphosphate 3-phosphatase n=1 Tax=Naumovozyma dairenensis (strain ATCC 10597 / BCRC 20456 / CBS 421 / NBRC 0211 / NRRL Y-12639) TaxID=1071378 RepID=G0WCU5_NAUDC|nr:hypothetical protein NDAI_0F02880 [Naumovozyma dairenensis CBS 421]CCD25606.1 hypothetical protein NDAI_0F02880 [Naumovozyma dairenensis CBS 421]
MNIINMTIGFNQKSSYSGGKQKKPYKKMEPTFQKHRRDHASNLIRSIYSAPLKVHKNNLGLTLDLSYITPNIIVCSYPVTKYPKLFYRNNLMDLLIYLNLNHGNGNWKIYNFKVESNLSDYTDQDVISLTNSSGVIVSNNNDKDNDNNNDNDNYNYNDHKNISVATYYLKKEAKIQNIEIVARDDSIPTSQLSSIPVSSFLSRNGWLDHSPPPFLLLQEIIDDIHNFTTSGKEKIAVLHCKMGKGRCGTICIAYLMKYNPGTGNLQTSSLDAAKAVFMNNRFKPGISKGVTIYSQLRFLKYHELFLYYDSMHRDMILNQLQLARFTFHSIELLEPTTIINSNFNSSPDSDYSFQYPYEISVNLQHYNETRNDLITFHNLTTSRDTVSSSTLSSPLSSSITPSNSSKKTKNDRLIMLLPSSSPLHLENTDIRLDFTLKIKSLQTSSSMTTTNKVISKFTSYVSHSHCWLNLYFETVKCSKNNSNTHFMLNELINEQNLGRQQFYFYIKWEDLDGLKGTNNRGLKLFDSIILKWSLHT